MSTMLPSSYQQCFFELKKFFPSTRYQENRPLAPLTSFRIGGKGDFMIEPTCAKEIAFIFSTASYHQVPCRIMGHGSNILVDDEGVRGIVILLSKHFSTITLAENYLTAQGGASLAAITKAAAKEGLGGMVPLCGIPGSLGGAVYMNAGAYGGEISQHFVKGTFLTQKGELRILSNHEMHFSYRHSILQEEPLLLIDATFSLEEGNRPQELFSQMKELNDKRNQKQPMEYPSAGSVFKRPEGHFASALIDQSQLKGATVGGAMVSLKHAGFIVNKENATAKDVKALISHIQKEVFQRFQVSLEPEIHIWTP